MRKLNAALLAMALVGMVASVPALAHGGKHRARVGVFIGAPVVFAPWYYPSYRYYHPPVVVAPPAPVVYVERDQPPPVQRSDAYWYYCPDSQTYYPYVQRCDVPWQRVLPRPPY
jgi:hypothetical protein